MDSEGVYAASCFYWYDAQSKALVFASDPDTHHMRAILDNPEVAGTIAPQRHAIHNIQGVQFRGSVHPVNLEQKRGYLNRFPMARSMKLHLWSIELEWVKMTDNTLGFKTKILWTTPQDDR